MIAVRYRLGIDFGTSNTVAVIHEDDGRSRPVLFDGFPLLPSCVCVALDGAGLLVGREANHAARVRPERYEPHPKRRIDDGTVLLGDVELPVANLIAAVLAQVKAETVRTMGGEPGTVVLTYPAAWGPRRRSVLLDAARLAGLGTPQLVPEPVAAAAFFVAATGAAVPVGSRVVVYDFGAGTFDASVVTRTDTGWEVIASEGLDDAGGLDIDTAIVDDLGTVHSPAHPDEMRRLINPQTVGDRRANRNLWEDVRTAKEILSRSASTYIHVPLIEQDAPLGREQLERLARPVVDRTVALTRRVFAGADPGRPLAGLFLVGGSSRMPLVATLLHQATGVAPTVLEQPELVVAEGSARPLATTGPQPAVEASGVRQSADAPLWPTAAATTQAPTGAPVSPAGAAEGYDSPAHGAAAVHPSQAPRRLPAHPSVAGAGGVYGTPVSAPPGPAAPISAPPMSATPASAPPVSGSPTPGSPTFGPPASGLPVSGPPMSGSPASGSPASGSTDDASPGGTPAFSIPPVSGRPVSSPPLPGAGWSGTGSDSGSGTGAGSGAGSGLPVSSPPDAGWPTSGPPSASWSPAGPNWPVSPAASGPAAPTSPATASPATSTGPAGPATRPEEVATFGAGPPPATAAPPAATTDPAAPGALRKTLVAAAVLLGALLLFGFLGDKASHGDWGLPYEFTDWHIWIGEDRIYLYPGFLLWLAYLFAAPASRTVARTVTWGLLLIPLSILMAELGTTVGYGVGTTGIFVLLIVALIGTVLVLTARRRLDGAEVKPVFGRADAGSMLLGGFLVILAAVPEYRYQIESLNDGSTELGHALAISEVPVWQWFVFGPSVTLAFAGLGAAIGRFVALGAPAVTRWLPRIAAVVLIFGALVTVSRIATNLFDS